MAYSPPSADSPALGLAHPTRAECLRIWASISYMWRESLTVDQFLIESDHMLNVPLARNGGMTLWILTDLTMPPDGAGQQRPILASCETFLKRALVATTTGDGVGNAGGDPGASRELAVRDKNIHGIASVFCEERFRGKGYAPRMLRELSRALRTFRLGPETNVGSVLYSDIGPDYYARFGWIATPKKLHVEFDSADVDEGEEEEEERGREVGERTRVPATQKKKRFEPARPLLTDHLPELCRADEDMLRRELSTPLPGRGTRFCIVPDLDHMLWNHAREEFDAPFNCAGRTPAVKGAIVGEEDGPGRRVWAVWTHRWYEKAVDGVRSSENLLYVLRLVVENEGQYGENGENGENRGKEKREELLRKLGSIVQAAREEAARWQLPRVDIWNPSPRVAGLLRDCAERGGTSIRYVERDRTSLACLEWWGSEDSFAEGTLEWVADERYCWC